MLFNPSRDEARRFFISTWQKNQQGLALADLEAVLIDVLMAHPEYHQFLTPDYIDHDWPPEHGDTNPFLHLSLHLALAEQLAIDQPAGVRALYQQLHAQSNDAHRALHIMLDCLAEMIWQAQRNQTQPNPAIYLDGIRKKIGIKQ